MNIARRIWGKEEVEMTSPDLFMPGWDKDLNEEQEPVKQTTEQQKQIWLQIARIQNRKVKKEKERESKLNKEPPKKWKGKK